MRMRPGGRLLEPGDQPQGRRLAAAGRAEQREERAGRDGEVEVLDRGEPGKALRDPDQLQVGAGLGEHSRLAIRRPGSRSGTPPGTSAPRRGSACGRCAPSTGSSSSGKISWLSARSGSILTAASLAPDDGRDVVHPGGDLGGDLRLVVVVDELSAFVLRGEPIGITKLSLQSVPPASGMRELPVVAGLGVERGDVARPADRGEGVAALRGR